MHASNPETIIYSAGFEPRPGLLSDDNRFRLNAHCANEPQRQAEINLIVVNTENLQTEVRFTTNIERVDVK